MSIRSLLLLLAALGSLSSTTWAQFQTDYLMDSDPKITGSATIRVVSPRYQGLWLQALTSPEQDLQRRASETIARAAGMQTQGLDQFQEPLKKVLLAESTLPAVRFAAARALTAIDAKNQAANLWDVAQKQGVDLRQLVEPTIATWDYQPARAVWLARLKDSRTRHRDMILAVRCLATVREVAALPTMREFVMNLSRSADLRLESATAAGLLAEQGLEAEAKTLLQDAQSSGVVSRVCAVRLLSRHASPVARELLVTAAKDAESSVAAAAMKRLIEIDPDLMLPLAESALAHVDPNVRRAGIDAYVLRPTPERMTAIGKLLDDLNPSLRNRVREEFLKLAATPALNDAIRAAGMRELAGSSWRGQEQAALLLAELDHEAAAMRLIELLEVDRPEVMVTSAWALRKLAVPETLPAMFDKANRQTTFRLGNDWRMELDWQVAHLLEAFSVMKYREAEPLLRKHVPKELKLGEYSRSAAIWSLGKFYENKVDEDLAKQLIARAADSASIPSEMIRVREMSAVTLGRMKAMSQLPRLRELMGPGPELSLEASGMRWAIMQMTGETLPEPAPVKTGFGFSFLEPQ